MSVAKRELWLFTMRFPFGRSEPFLENELPYLCERFEKVRLFPLFEDEGIREIPENASVTKLIQSPFESASVFDLLKYWSVWTFVMERVRNGAPGKSILKKQKGLIRSRFRQALKRALVLRAGLMKDYNPTSVTLYSYWNYDWALVLSILKRLDPRVRFVTRMLGFDMFRFRAPDNWPAFRELQLEMADANYIISKAGLEHMLEHYREFEEQYELAYLATHDHGINPSNSTGPLHLVSCANMVPLKRIDLLVKALPLIDQPVKWTHFGDGEEMERIRMMVGELPDHIQVSLKGSTKNKDILEWYRTEPVDLFVHTSSTEGGVPVALQEAASFGIPLIGTDVGGIPEIVNDHTGALLAANPTPEEIATCILQQYKRVQENPGLRSAVREYWSERFRADKVYRDFADRLIRH